jgi:DsbC/DsbD-like thiol-disulfide interchange protein
MTIIFRSVQAFVFLILFLFPAFAQSPTSSSWAQGLHSRVRLIAGGTEGTRLLGGVEIALDPGYKTYWRTPGDSGLPPNFDWSGSENVAAIDIRWPAPSRQEDAGGVAYVYGGGVTLPVLVQPKEPDKPVRIVLAVDYGVCKDICIPAHAKLSATLSREGMPHVGIAKALAQVPRPQALGAKADAAVTGIERVGQDKHSFIVTVRVPEGTKPALFAEGPESWYLSTSLPDAGNRFTVTVEDKPKETAGPVPVRLTLVAGSHAIETEVSLDVARQPR